MTYARSSTKCLAMWLALLAACSTDQPNDHVDNPFEGASGTAAPGGMAGPQPAGQGGESAGVGTAGTGAGGAGGSSGTGGAGGAVVPEPEDHDGDGVSSGDGGMDADNCPEVANAGQEDADRDGDGDVCDNCPSDPNPAQGDADRDGRGDACSCETQPEPEVLCEDATAGGLFPCNKIDMLAHITGRELGSKRDNVWEGNDLWGWHDQESGREFALALISDATVFVEVTNPHCPVIAGRLPSASGSAIGRDALVYRDHAYLGAETPGHGMQVFDLKQLTEARTEPETFEALTLYRGATNHVIGNSHTMEINVDAGYAYLAGTADCSGGLHIVDIRTPAEPRFAGCYSGSGYIHETQCVRYRGPDAEYEGRDLCFAAVPSRGIAIIDVTDPEAATLIASKSYSDLGYPHQGHLTQDHGYFVFGDEFDETTFGHRTRTLIFDVRALSAPEYVGAHVAETTSIDHNQYVLGPYSYQANMTAGLRIMDLRNVASAELTEIAYFDGIPDSDAAQMYGSWAAYPYLPSGTILLNGSHGLFVLRLHADLQPVNAASVP